MVLPHLLPTIARRDDLWTRCTLAADCSSASLIAVCDCGCEQVVRILGGNSKVRVVDHSAGERGLPQAGGCLVDGVCTKRRRARRWSGQTSQVGRDSPLPALVSRPPELACRAAATALASPGLSPHAAKVPCASVTRDTSLTRRKLAVRNIFVLPRPPPRGRERRETAPGDL